MLDVAVDVGGMELKLTFVSMGNPHAVAFIESPVNRFPRHRIGPQVEHHAIFPNKVNFSVVNVKEGRWTVARVWERGAGRPSSTVVVSSTWCCAVVDHP